MSLVSVLKVNKWYGRKNILSIITFDSRVSDSFTKEGKEFRAKYDCAEKVLCLSPNVLVGIAGDYSAIEVIKNLGNYLNEGKRYMQCHRFLSHDIKDYLENAFRDRDTEVDILILIKNYSGVRTRIFKMCFPGNVFVELDTDNDYMIHSIGSSAHIRNQVMMNFEDNDLRNRILYNGSSNVDSPVIITKLFALSNMKTWEHDQDIGGYQNSYYIDKDGWHNIRMALSSDNGEHFIGSALGEDGINIQVNGKVHTVLSSDSIEVNMALQRKGGR